MDLEFSRLVNQAAESTSSGRWAAVNTRIGALAAHPGQDNEWWAQLFGALCYQNFSEYLLLKKDYENRTTDDVALLAWRARNLLELCVWSVYCAKSRENAPAGVYEDAGRDVRGILDAFIKWGTTTTQSSDWLDPIAAAKMTLADRALHNDGIRSLDGRFKEVRDAAKECGLGDHFAVSYKMLSKFAHATSMRILAPKDERRKNACATFSSATVVFVSPGLSMLLKDHFSRRVNSEHDSPRSWHG